MRELKFYTRLRLSGRRRSRPRGDRIVLMIFDACRSSGNGSYPILVNAPCPRRFCFLRACGRNQSIIAWTWSVCCGQTDPYVHGHATIANGVRERKLGMNIQYVYVHAYRAQFRAETIIFVFTNNTENHTCFLHTHKHTHTCAYLSAETAGYRSKYLT